jgi:CRP/FNR family transcriptional regulator, nitrogen fixation regulation protein
MLMRPPRKVVPDQSPRSQLPKFRPGLNTIAVHSGLNGIRMAYGSIMEIFGEGEPTEYLYEVVRGLVRHCKIFGDGRRQITSFHIPGEVFGLEPDDEHHFSAEAVTDSIILAVKRSAIMGLAACDVYFVHQLWAVTARDYWRSRNHIMVLGYMKARQRVAAFLLPMVPRSSGDDEIELEMSRQDIADYLGLTIETVSRTITQFEQEALIGIASARRIVIRDRAALTAVAVHDNSRASHGYCERATATCATKSQQAANKRDRRKRRWTLGYSACAQFSEATEWR